MPVRLYIFVLSMAVSLNMSKAAQKPAEKTNLVLNQILFYESAQSWTTRDHDLYVKLKNLVLQKPRISQFVETEDEDFLLSRLTARESLLFELSAEKMKLSDSQRKSLSEFTNNEIDQELKQISLSLALIELKEAQLKQKLRFKTWFDLLKRKYQVKIKS